VTGLGASNPANPAPGTAGPAQVTPEPQNTAQTPNPGAAQPTTVQTGTTLADANQKLNEALGQKELNYAEEENLKAQKRKSSTDYGPPGVAKFFEDLTGDSENRLKNALNSGAQSLGTSGIKKASAMFDKIKDNPAFQAASQKMSELFSGAGKAAKAGVDLVQSVINKKSP
jgi:hypothetical protein